MIFPGDSIPRHPSQLYEALLEGPALLLLLWSIHRFRRPRDGRTAALFLVFYGVFRFVVEFTRRPDPQLGFIAFGWLTMGQLLSAVLALAGLMLWLILGRPASGLAHSRGSTHDSAAVQDSPYRKEFTSHE
jgi:phosphatidylglycerol:prolipoprotein diacylglycerol transferase